MGDLGAGAAGDVIRDAAAGESGCTRMLSALGRLAGAAGQWRGQMPLRARRCSPGTGFKSLRTRTDGLRILRKARCPSDLAAVTALRAGRDDPRASTHKMPAILLIVPRTLFTSCDQAVFVDHATDASVSPDVVSLKIDRFG
jgi:hypothetical protein